MNHAAPPTTRAASVIATCAAALLLAACGGGGGGGGPAPPPPDDASLPGASTNAEIRAEQRDEANALAGGQPVTALPVQMPENSAVRFLNQATFGSTEALTAAVRTEWRWGWLQAQFALPTARTHWDSVKADQAAWLAEDSTRSADNLPNVVWDWSVWEAYMTAPDALRKRVGYALSQIMVVSMEGLASGGTNNPLLAAGYLDVLEAGAFGNFRQLIEAVSLNPAMGYYLSHRGNRRAEYPNNDPTQPPLRVPDENYAREVMQLFTIGLVDLNPDGTPKLDTTTGLPRETYGEDDVRGLARVFTGWDFAPRSDPDWTRKPMVHTASRHSPEAKSFLGVTIPANTDGPASLKIALDTLFNHPNTAPFISKQLIQRLVTSNPSKEYVARVSARFANNGQGVRGDMKAVVDAVLRDTEARSPLQITQPAAGWGKLREPVLRYTTFARAFKVSNAGEIWRIPALSDPASGLGQSPLRSPSVFNFYRPGYVPPNTAIARASLVAPEFQISTDTSLPGYVNFMQRQLGNTPIGGLVFDYAAELALAADPAALADLLNRKLLNGAMNASTRSEIVATVAALPGGTAGTAAQNLNRVRTAILMALAAPEFVVQK
jgi:uncharacterized protein (DUF1800 family)